MSRRIAGWVSLGCVVALAAILPLRSAAQSLQSPNYRFEESSLGAGGLIQSSSANYKADGAAGAFAVGDAASANLQVKAGPKTSPDPTLSFIVDDTSADFGVFSPTAAAVTTSTFTVSNYTSYGYTVQIEGEAPSNGAHTIDAMATTASPQIGTEQFGINLVANTAPQSIGANPDQGEFGAGVASPNYGESNKFRYVSGEAIATAPKSSGITSFTMTYMINVEGLTPGGKYTSDQTIVVIGTY